MISASPRSLGLSGDPSKNQGYSGIGEPSESMRRLEEVDGVPVVRPAASLAAQVGPDAAGAEHHRALQLVLVFLGLRDRPPAPILVRDRTDELAVAVPAALADVDLAAQPQGLSSPRVEPLFALRRRPGAGAVGRR